MTASSDQTSGRWTEASVLVTVKAAPQPSAQHGDTVCVAGVCLSPGKPRWIRLYPVPFRYLTDSRKFAKYDIIQASVRRADTDPRSESHKLNLDTIRKTQSLDHWKSRLPHVQPLIEDNMCALIERSRDQPGSQSLAAIRPAEIRDLKIDRHSGWQPDQLRKLEAFAAQGTLFGEHKKHFLRAPRFVVKYSYRCHNRRCNGHNQSILDWEVVSHQFKLENRSENGAKFEIRKRWLDDICSTRNDVAFYVGNLVKRPHVFGVLGVFYPPRGSIDQYQLEI